MKKLLILILLPAAALAQETIQLPNVSLQQYRHDQAELTRAKTDYIRQLELEKQIETTQKINSFEQEQPAQFVVIEPQPDRSWIIDFNQTGRNGKN